MLETHKSVLIRFESDTSTKRTCIKLCMRIQGIRKVNLNWRRNQDLNILISFFCKLDHFRAQTEKRRCLSGWIQNSSKFPQIIKLRTFDKVAVRSINFLQTSIFITQKHTFDTRELFWVLIYNLMYDSVRGLHRD